MYVMIDSGSILSGSVFLVFMAHLDRIVQVHRAHTPHNR